MWKPRNQTQRAAFRREARVWNCASGWVAWMLTIKNPGTLAQHWDISIYILYHFVKRRRVSCWCQISCDFNSRNWPANQRFSGGIVADWQRNMGPLEKPLGVSNKRSTGSDFTIFHHENPGIPVWQFWLGTRPGNFLHFANLKPWRRNNWFTQLQHGGSFQFVFCSRLPGRVPNQTRKHSLFGWDFRGSHCCVYQGCTNRWFCSSSSTGPDL